MIKTVNSHYGFTLIELMITVSLIGILVVSVATGALRWRADMELGGAAREVLSVLQQARLQGVKEQSPVVVSFDPDGNGLLEGNYQGFVDSDDDLNSAGEKIFANGNLPGDITVDKVAFPVAGVNFACFNAQGFPDRGGTLYNGAITLQNVKGATRQVVLNAAGGVAIQ